jgi:hypothetical protein
MWQVKNKFRAKTNSSLSRDVAGVVVRLLVEICIDNISAFLRATDLRFRLPFVSWADGLIHFILRILKFLNLQSKLRSQMAQILVKDVFYDALFGIFA